MCPSPATRIKPLVFLVEPHPLALECLRHTLREKNRLRIVSEEKFLDNELPTHLDPVFVIDKGTAPVPFTKYLDNVRLRLHRPKLIVMDRECPPKQQFAMLSLGIRGVVVYRDVRKKLVAAIAEVARGGLWVAREILTDYVTGSSQESSASHAAYALTTRELQVFRLLEKHLSNKEICVALSISESTVKFHLANIFAKLQVRDRRSAVDLVTDDHNQKTAPSAVQSGSPLPKLLVAAKSA